MCDFAYFTLDSMYDIGHVSLMFNCKRATELKNVQGRTITWLAKQIDHTEQVTKDYLSGKRDVRRPIAVTLAIAFGVAIDELWNPDAETTRVNNNAA
jgi:hypothetical protein